MREPGYYWVKEHCKDEPEVAWLHGNGAWYMPSEGCRYAESELAVLSERLLPPDWDKGPPLKSEG